MLDRRSFLFSSAAVAAAASLPFDVAEAQLTNKPEDNPPVQSKDLYDRDQEAYWAELRKQFLIGRMPVSRRARPQPQCRSGDRRNRTRLHPPSIA